MDMQQLILRYIFLWNMITSKIKAYGLTAQTEGDVGYHYIDNEHYDQLYGEEEDNVIGIEPTFDVPMANVTVIEGQDALLPCSIDNLGKHQVLWQDRDLNALTYEDRRMVDDTRFSVLRPYIREWNLEIDEVKWEDQGTYRCTVNTTPPKMKTVSLHVKVPAKIIDELSSNDVTVEEGQTVILVCNVTGVPKPTVTWHRRPAHGQLSNDMESKKCKFQRNGPGIGSSGEMIIIQNVTRYCDDIYECVAYNDVGDSATSRQMRVTVEFPPEVHLPNRKQWQDLNKETILQCDIYAFPQVESYWLKDDRPIKSSEWHQIETYNAEYTHLVLTIRMASLRFEDFGKYSCVAKNNLGKDKKDMYLQMSNQGYIETTRKPFVHVVQPRLETPITPYIIDSVIPGKKGENNVMEIKSARSAAMTYTRSSSIHIYMAVIVTNTILCTMLML